MSTKRIDIKAGATTRRLFSVTLSADGSFYVAIVRGEPSKGRRRWNSDTLLFEEALMSAGPRRVSYHTTGRVNYHGLVEGESLYFEPLVAVSRTNSFLALSLPSLDFLDITEEGSDALIIENNWHTNQPLWVGLSVVPLSTIPSHNTFALVDFITARLFIELIPPPLPIPDDQRDRFIYAKPSVGPFGEQQFPRLEAELAYCQAQHGREMVVYPPDGQGVYTLYPSVVMRETPHLEIDFSEPRYSAEIVNGSRSNRLKFKVRGPGGYIRSGDLRPLIQEIRLDAEL